MGAVSDGGKKDIHSRCGSMPLVWSRGKLQKGENRLFHKEGKWGQIHIRALLEVRVPCGKMREDAARNHDTTLTG